MKNPRNSPLFPLSPSRLFRAALALSLTVSALLFFLWSWRWPLVGDASLMHYLGFLIERGWVPYAQFGDMNMPGSYLTEIAAMRLFGMDDLAWRLFDFTLLGLASASFFVITHRAGPGTNPRGAHSDGWLAGLFSACLFILVHGRDGLAQAGQRDLDIAVLLTAATAFLFLSVRGRVLWPIAAFGLLSGIAATIKPTPLPLTLVQLGLAIAALHARRAASPQRAVERPAPTILRIVLTAALAYLIAPAIVLVFLLREHALHAFLDTLHGVVPYYAGLGHRPIGYILLHSISPLLSLVILWLVSWLVGLMQNPSLRLSRPDWTQDWERLALFAGVLFGLVNCIIQPRALPYHRYPLLVFLLPLMAGDFTRAIDTRDTSKDAAPSPVPSSWAASCRRALAILALAIGGFFLSPQSAVLIHRDRWWENDFASSLQQNLTGLGGPTLSGRIQCIDSVSGCGTVLYRMRLEPATGVLSDYLLFGAVTDRQPSGEIPIIRQTRAQFSAAVLAHPPQVIVVTSHLYIDGPDNFEKLARWPAFAQFLAHDYTLRTQWFPNRTVRWWSREELPRSYRIYVLTRPEIIRIQTIQR